LPQSAPSETGKKPEKSKFYEIGKEGGPAKSSAETVRVRAGILSLGWLQLHDAREGSFHFRSVDESWYVR
jgi:hypothetical protein